MAHDASCQTDVGEQRTKSVQTDYDKKIEFEF